MKTEERVRRAFQALSDDARTSTWPLEVLASGEGRNKRSMLVPALAIVTVIVVGLGAWLLLRPSDEPGEIVVAAEPTVVTEEPPPATDAAPDPEPTPSTTPTTTPAEPEPADRPRPSVAAPTVNPDLVDKLFFASVVNVRADDVLYVRSGPGSEHERVSSYAPDFNEVRLTGAYAPAADGGTWLEVEYEPEQYGWSNAGFLADGFGPDRGCPSPDAASDALAFDSGSASHAGRVSGLEFYEVRSCQRIVIALDSDTVPAGLRVQHIDGFGIVVTLPGVTSVQPEATDAGNGGLYAIVARENDGSLTVRADLGSPIDQVEFLSDPARIVIDSFPTAVGAGFEPHVGDSVILANRRVVRGDDVVAFGWARAFEATVEYTITSRDGVVVADGFATANDWLEAWGRFEFRVDDLDPGIYELFIGQSDQRGGDERIGLVETIVIPD